jgi:hypothetical protein
MISNGAPRSAEPQSDARSLICEHGRSPRHRPRVRFRPRRGPSADCVGRSRTRTGARSEVTRQTIPNQTLRPLAPPAHVGDPGGQIDPCNGTQSKHGFRLLQDAQQAFERTRIRVRCTSIRRPPGSTPASPQVGSRSSAISWPPTPPAPNNRPKKLACSLSSTALLQMAIQSAEPQTRLSQTRSAAYRCSQTRPPTAEAPHSYIAWALTALFLRSSGHCNTDPACRTRVLLRLLRVLRDAYTPLHHGDTETRRNPCSCSVFPLTSPSSQCLRGRESSDIRNSVQ